MSEILFLAHRLPFPPDKGDKIRSYHLLEHLIQNYDVHLGCFIDDPDDERYVEKVEALCASSNIVRLDPRRARFKSMKGLLSGQALSLPYYYDKSLASWIERIIRERVVISIITYSSPMGQYVMGKLFDRYRRIMDFVDVDSDKWRQYAKGKRWPISLVYAREARRLLEFEKSIARDFDASIFVTPNEVELFDKLAPETSDKHYSVSNGVATDFFDPGKDFDNPFRDKSVPLVFTGMMDYWANVDAASWFAREVFPRIRSNVPAAEFWIVGASPTKEVLALGSLAGVHVTGRVRDVRPYLKYAKLAVAPLRIARGIQNKVLEAMAMSCPVLCTTHAASGLKESARMPVTIVDSASEMAASAIDLLQSGQIDKAHNLARQYTLDNYGWDHSLAQFERIHTGSITT